jgi:transaldolase
MKLFLDTADFDEIKAADKTGLIDGITTNPTLIKKSGRDPLDVYRDIRDLGITDISMEVSGDHDKMLEDALALNEQFSECITVKLPMTVEGLQVCSYLSQMDIRTNVTLIFNAAQALLAAKAGATYVSPFVGRIDDQGYAGTEVVRSCAELLRRTDTQVLAASIRTPQRVVRCFYSGADIVTMPPKVFWSMYQHVLTDVGLEIFEKDLIS